MEAVVLMVGCLANDALNLRHSGQSGWSPLMDSVGGGVVIAGAIVLFEGESVGVCWCTFCYHLFYVCDVTFSNYMFVLG